MSRVVIEKRRDLAAVKKLIDSHHFNHQIEVLLPAKVVENDEWAHCEYYVVETELSFFLGKEVLEMIQKAQDQFMCLSIETHIDKGNCFALLPDGKLILSVDKDTFEKIGLNGKLSKYSQRYIVEIDLRAKGFTNDKKLFQRVQWSFENQLTEKYKFLMIVQNKDFVFPSTIQFKKTTVDQEFNFYKKIPIPQITLDENISQETLFEFFEWIGMVSCQALETTVEESVTIQKLISSYEPFEPSIEGTVTSLKWTGFFSPAFISKTLDHYMEIKDINFFVINVWGFDDTPISWQMKEHGYLTNGDNHYSICFFPDQNFIIFRTIGEHDLL